MKISELSKLCNISPRMLRYYEQANLLSPQRTLSGYREYSMKDVERVKLICQLNAAGLTLSTIKKIIPCWKNHNKEFSPCAELKASLKKMINQLDEQIDVLAQSRSQLTQLLQKAQSA